MFYVRREPSVQAAAESLQRGRSVRGWGTAGYCWRCWAEVELHLGPVEAQAAGEAAIVDQLELEPAPWAVRGSRTSCGHDGVAYAQYLPGLCALAEYESVPEQEEALADAAESYSFLPVLALFEGEPEGYDPEEGWPLFRPTRLVWVKSLD